MKEIIKKYLEDTATNVEKAELLQWLRNRNLPEFKFHRLRWEKELSKNEFPGHGKETWSKIQSVLLDASYREWQKSQKIQLFLKYAAIFLLLTTITSMSWYFASKSKSPSDHFTKVIADQGQISQVELPDGSQVWLNSSSTISYSNNFAEKNRDVYLEGEAYFIVAKNKNLPLLVKCGELYVRVTGTKFNVNAFPGNKKISVVLEEGALELFQRSNALFKCAINPGEIAEYDVKNRELSKRETNTKKYVSWKEGIINIYDQTLEEVAERLKTRYNQEFIIMDDVKHYHYTFTIKNESLDKVIQLIEKITPVKAEQNGTVITFKADKNMMKRLNK